MTIRLTRYFGLQVERSQGSDRRWYLSYVAWYRRAPKRLGYLYWSHRSI